MKLSKKYWESLNDNQQRRIKDSIKTIITAAAVIAATIFGFCSCNVTRTITNESSVYQKGDTSVVIQTRTLESYNAKKNL